MGPGPYLPSEVCADVRAWVRGQPAQLVWTDDPAQADLLVEVGDSRDGVPAGEWVLAVAAPFFTVQDDISVADIRSAWRGVPAGTMAGRSLLATEETVTLLAAVWGAADADTVSVASTLALLPRALVSSAYVILPVHRLAPHWQVLRIDGSSPLGKGTEGAGYAFRVPFRLTPVAGRPTSGLRTAPGLSNWRDDEKTIAIMTGVTAPARDTARMMDWRGAEYLTSGIAAWFEGADYVHISNEVSFCADCPPSNDGALVAPAAHISLLESIHASVIELTGNHLVDKGSRWLDYTLGLYRERGWRWYGGGENGAEAAEPLLLEQGPNRIAFVGCSVVGPWADDHAGGASPCDFDDLRLRIARLARAGYLPIVTIQHREEYSYTPSPEHVRDLRSLAEAGAVWVQGSQAHQPQTMEFHAGAFIHYGLGNLFFDQMDRAATRQGFVDRLVFHRGRLLSIDLRPTYLEEPGRPRPMTAGDPTPDADSARFLRMLFGLGLSDREG